MSKPAGQPDAQIGPTLVSTPDRDRRGQFTPGNRASAADKRSTERRKVVRVGAELLTVKQRRAHAERLHTIIARGEPRDALAAFKLLYGRVSDPGRPKPAPAPPTSTAIQLPVPPEIKYNG